MAKIRRVALPPNIRVRKVPAKEIAQAENKTETQAKNTEHIAQYPAGLSRREVEILRLVALGLTNSEIASRQFLSPNTVRAHLYSIYAKTGVTSRAGLARFAVEHNLLNED